MSTCVEMSKYVDQLNDDSPMTRKINNLLISSRTRMEGLRLLKSFISQCSDEDFLQFCISWMQNCCKTDGLIGNKDYPIHILSNLIEKSSNYQELKKSVSFFITTRYFDFFFKYFLTSEVGWSCTETCLLLYRGACGSFQESLEKHLKNEITQNIKVPSSVAACFALIPGLGGGGIELINCKKNWKNQFIKFSGFCHYILDNLFADIEFEDFQLQEQKKYEKSSFDNLQNKSKKYLATQLYNHSKVLNCMLLNQYFASKSIPVDLIFELICRGLALNPNILIKHNTTESASLLTILPEVYYVFLSLLKALIVTCKSQLLPYSYIICKLIKQILQWTEYNCSLDLTKAFKHVRIFMYEVLCNWLAVAKNGSCVETVSSVIMSQALSDIMPKKGFVVLKEKKLQNQNLNREQAAHKVDAISNSDSDLCHAALKALQFLLKFVGVSMKSEEQKLLQEIVLKLLERIQKNSVMEVPFSEPACRSALYSLLLELVHQTSSKRPPPTNFALNLFSRGVNDISPEVSSFCTEAINFTTIIIHPQYNNGKCVSFGSHNEEEFSMEVKLPWNAKPIAEENESKLGDEEIALCETGETEEFLESTVTKASDKLIDLSHESEISSDEDSRNTVTFLKETLDSDKKNQKKDFKIENPCVANQPGEEPLIKKQRISGENLSSEKTSSPGKEKPGEIDSFRRTQDNREINDQEDQKSVKSTSPESVNGEIHPKTRYFLRSKRKESSEEREEALKKSVAPEAFKSTPRKSSVKRAEVSLSATKKPRTRAPSKAKTNSPTGTKTLDKIVLDDGVEKEDDEEGVEEDLRAAFDDSFID